MIKKAIILAAGEGKRMRPLTLDIPKPLIKVAGKTLLDGILDALPDSIIEIIIVVGYKGDQIKNYLGDFARGKKIHYVWQEKQTGTADAVFLTKNFFKGGERFFVIYGDELTTRNQVKECLKHEFSWLCHKMADARHSGVAEMNSEGRIVNIEEKPEHPQSNLVVGGVMLVNADIFKYKPTLHRNGEYYLTSMMTGFIKDHIVKVVVGFANLGFTSPEDIKKTEDMKLSLE